METMYVGVYKHTHSFGLELFMYCAFNMCRDAGMLKRRAAESRSAREADSKLWPSDDKHKSITRLESLLTHVTESHPDR